MKKAIWLWKFISELEVAPSIDGLVLLYCDSNGAIAQVKVLKFHQCIKHILRRYDLIQEIVDRDDIDLQKINKKKNRIDRLTKALEIKEFDEHKSKMGNDTILNDFSPS